MYITVADAYKSVEFAKQNSNLPKRKQWMSSFAALAMTIQYVRDSDAALDLGLYPALYKTGMQQERTARKKRFPAWDAPTQFEFLQKSPPGLLSSVPLYTCCNSSEMRSFPPLTETSFFRRRQQTPLSLIHI